MTAFNVVRFRVKPGHEAEFIEAQKKSREDLAGSKRFTMIKTGDRSYCIIGEWDSMQNLIGALILVRRRNDRSWAGCSLPTISAFGPLLGVLPTFAVA